jgi:ABC-type uncharacterized transport system YnjBCD ATPase subunit/ABC-type spermidine/putrescine transport system permease subunit II
VFRTVVLPQLVPAIGAGGLLVALYVLSDFGAVSILRFDSFTRVIYTNYRSSFEREGAAALAALLVAVTLLVLWLEGRTRGSATLHRIAPGAPRRARTVALGRWKAPALGFVGAVVLFALVLPVGVLGYWSTRSVAGEVEWDVVAGAAGNSLLAAAVAAVVAAAAACPSRCSARATPGRVSALIERVSFAGHALPGIVVALALVFLGTRAWPALYQTLAMLVLAYVVLFLPQAIGATRAALLQIDPHVEEAARSLGRTPLAVLRTITAPLARSGRRGRRAARLPHRGQGAPRDAPAGADRLRHPGDGDLAHHELQLLRTRSGAEPRAPGGLRGAARPPDDPTARRTMSAIRAIGVHKAFGPVKAVDGLNLDIAEGEICALLGPSGCGKTTMLRLLAGFEAPDAGCITLGGEIIAGGRTYLAPERARIGMVFQDYALFPHLTVEGNVLYALGGRAGRNADARRGSPRCSSSSAWPTSAGASRTSSPAASSSASPWPARWPAPPSWCLLDEPFSGLDAALRARVRQEVRAILLAAGVTALFVTTTRRRRCRSPTASRSCATAASSSSARPRRSTDGPPRAGSRVPRRGRRPARHRRGGLGRVRARPRPRRGRHRGDAEVLVRPESVALSLGPAAGGRTQLEAVVVEREFFGHDQLVHVELPSGRRLRSRSLSYPVWHPGDRVRVQLDGPVNVYAAT